MKTLSILLLPLACAAVEPSAVKPIPISAFVGGEELAHPRLSPDGKHIAMTTRMVHKGEEVRALAIDALPGLERLTMMPFPATEVPLHLSWADNTRLAIGRGYRQGSRGPVMSRGEVLAVNADGKRARYLYGAEGRMGPGYGYVASARNGRVLVGDVLWDSPSTSLVDIDAATGNSGSVTDVPQAHAIFVLQNDGYARFAYGTGEKDAFQLWRRGGKDGDWQRVPTGQVGALLKPVAFSADDSEFFAFHSAAGGPLALIAENLATGVRRVAAADPQGSIVELMQGTPRTGPFAALSSVGVPRVHYLKPDSDRDVALHRQLSEHFAGATVEFIDASEGGGKMLFMVHSDRDPGTYYLYDRATNKAAMLSARMEAINPEQMAPRRPITFAARDGETLHGFLTMPSNASGARVPLVLIPHDGPNTFVDTWYFDADAQFLASRGYAVLQVNFRGSSNRGPAFEKAGFGQWRGKIMDDLVDGVRWATQQPNVDASRMCVFGTGFGAFSAMTLASREPKLFKCAIGYSGIYDLVQYDRADFLSEVGSPNVVRRFVNDRHAELNDMSPIAHANAIDSAVLLIHGGEDNTAPKAHAERMRSALQKAGREPEWYFVKNEGHGFHKLENQVEVYRRLESFLAKHIGK